VTPLPFDPGDPEFLADPYPVFDALRERGEVQFHPGMGMAVALSHSACSAVLRDRELGRVFDDAQPVESFAFFNLLHHHSLLENEPPAHTRLRRIVSAAFSRGHIERLRPWVAGTTTALVHELVTRIRDDGSADLLERLANPLPVQVIAELLGVPEADRSLLQPWSNAIVKMYEYGLPEQQQQAAERAAREFVGYLRELAAARRASPASDFMSELATGPLGDDETVATAALLLMAGHEASVNTVGNGVLALLRDRAQWELLVADPGLAESAVEEVIRFDSPLQCFERTAATDLTIAGYPIRSGERVVALLGAAAHDPAVFDRPNSLHIRRAPNPHLGFGGGIHYCLGAPLARIEAAAALRALVTTIPDLELASEPVRRKEFVIRGLQTLSVTGHRDAPSGRAARPAAGAP
jgi:cytochrome P450